MNSAAVWFLGLVSIGFGCIFYAAAYLSVRPMLVQYGLLKYVPALGGASTVLGALPVLALTWLAVRRLFSLLDIDKM